jgi:hypothetical protein
LQVHPVPLIAVGTRVFGTLGNVSVTVTVVPSVGPAPAASLTVMVYLLPVEFRGKFPLWVFVMDRLACATVRLADAVLPVPPLVELTGPVVLV